MIQQKVRFRLAREVFYLQLLEQMISLKDGLLLIPAPIAFEKAPRTRAPPFFSSIGVSKTLEKIKIAQCVSSRFENTEKQ